MNIVLEHKADTKISNKVLINIWRLSHRARTRIGESMLIFSALLFSLFFLIGNYALAIKGLIFVGLCVFLSLSGTVKKIEKLMSGYAGVKLVFEDDCFYVGKMRYQYSEITKIVKSDEFVIIIIKGKYLLPIIITEDNRQKIGELVNAMQLKGVI